ncbi:MAG: PilZ domain-containing protein [Elusimicrobia bacterium]|nr:PilZ domain-containing protein [Elusimicrobiota bacterium]
MAAPGPNRRAHARHPCQMSCQLVNTGGDPLPGELLNIGMGGAAIRVYGMLRARSFTLKISTATEVLAVDCRVVRTDPPAPGTKFAVHGVLFSTDPTTQTKLRILIDQVRSRSNMGGPKTMGGYWKPR